MKIGIARWISLTAVTLMVCSARPIQATNDPQIAAIQQAIVREFKLTKATADNTDVVTPGSVIVLHKDGLQMCSTIAKVPLVNIYKNGSLSAAKFAWGMALGLAQSQVSASDIPIRKFVEGEKFWVTGIAVRKGGLVLQVLSDLYGDNRYYGQVEFPFDKKSVPTGDDTLKVVEEVLTAEPAEYGVQAQSPAPPLPDTPVAPLQPIAPPPPPADEPPAAPKRIALGQTKNEVVAILGQPQKVADLGTKQIDYYPDMKVVFVKGKVTDIQ